MKAKPDLIEFHTLDIALLLIYNYWICINLFKFENNGSY